jgi:tRNA modification GTPase
LTQRHDTIVAVATPSGSGGVGVVRLSGPDAHRIAQTLAGPLPPARAAAVRVFKDTRGPIDQGLFVRFDAPHSYTGEHVAELQGHGSPVVLDALVHHALSLGARMAGPGEFTQRAYLNDRLDLAEAEAVADLIAAGSTAAARAAHRSLTGEFSRRVNQLAADIESIRIEVEASIDFVDEDIQLQEEAAVAQRLRAAKNDLAVLLNTAGQGRLLTEGCTVVIAGRPNAGKSSLLNALVGHEAAIVTDIPGTTRDVLRERLQLNGVPLTLLDTAGLRDADDVVEAEGVRRARASINTADHVLYLVDASDADACAQASDEIAALGRASDTTLVLTKADLVDERQEVALTISILDGSGLVALRQHLTRVLGVQSSSESLLSARRRHLDALTSGGRHLDAAAHRAKEGDTDLFAEELRLAHDALGEITGRVTSDDLLGRIFSTFCIGK